jgi:hypothetical protein
MKVKFYLYSWYESKNDWTFKLIPTIAIGRDTAYGYVFDISLQWLFFDFTIEIQKGD